MKIAILYDSKYGCTKEVAEFLADKAESANHEVQLFRTKGSKPSQLLGFGPEVLLVGTPTQFGRPARPLGNYLKDMKKLITRGSAGTVQKAAAFNCYQGDIICNEIEKKISEVYPNCQIHEQSLAVKTLGERGPPLSDNWEESSLKFILGFLEFLK
ncbi:MAG: flavodoxin family protein [Promethearchaeota archaeon]